MIGRVFWDEDDQLRPGKGGIVLKPRHLPALADAISKGLSCRDRARVAAEAG